MVTTFPSQPFHDPLYISASGVTSKSYQAHLSFSHFLNHFLSLHSSNCKFSLCTQFCVDGSQMSIYIIHPSSDFRSIYWGGPLGVRNLIDQAPCTTQCHSPAAQVHKVEVNFLPLSLRLTGTLTKCISSVFPYSWSLCCNCVSLDLTGSPISYCTKY